MNFSEQPKPKPNPNTYEHNNPIQRHHGIY